MGLRIDLGCGKNKVEGCIGVDAYPGNEPDIVADIKFPIKELANECAEFVVCRHVLEHLEVNEWQHVFNEICRLLEPGGRFEVRVPHPAYEDSMIHGHIHVLTPRFWHDADRGGWLGGVVVDRVEETQNPECLEFCEARGLVFHEWARFLRNAYVETVVTGHKP